MVGNRCRSRFVSFLLPPRYFPPFLLLFPHDELPLARLLRRPVWPLPVFGATPLSAPSRVRPGVIRVAIINRRATGGRGQVGG